VSEQDKAGYRVNMPSEFRTALKIHAAKTHTSINSIIVNLIDEYLRKNDLIDSEGKVKY
jgi:hypothetical protein